MLQFLRKTAKPMIVPVPIRHLVLLLFFGVSLGSMAQGTLKVVVLLNKPEACGTLHVALYSSVKAYKSDTACAIRTVAIDGNMALCTFDSLTPGICAIKVFQDVNGNGLLDTSWLGWPKEPIGYSNNAPVNTGTPPFKLAAIQVKDGSRTERILLH